jgi:hypothetical protein
LKTSESKATRSNADLRVESAGTGATARQSVHGTTLAQETSRRIAPSFGGPLSASDYSNLELSWITREIADAAMLRRVDAQEGREAIGQKGKRDCAGILFPCYWPDETHPHSLRLRRDNPDLKQGPDGKLKPDRKYYGEPGSSNRLYFPPGIDCSQLSDSTTPGVIVEGEKKALALQRLAWHGVEKPRFIPMAISGVWNWRGTVGKAEGPRGERVDVHGPINDLNRIVWSRRTVYVLFDADGATNDNVKWARTGLARELAKRDALIQFVNMPENCGVNGIDDLLNEWGPERVLELFEKSTPGIKVQVMPPPEFRSRPEGMFRVTTRNDQLTEIPLTNFQAAIVASTSLDDGVETKREFEIRGQQAGRSMSFSVPANRFAQMDWTIEFMGPNAITFPNQKDYARAAIQSASVEAAERVVFTHSGWRQINGRATFLHAGGGIDSDGAVQGIHVNLPGTLSRCELVLPVTSEALNAAVGFSLKLTELIPPSLGFPILAAVCRSVLGDPDFALHVAGETGAFKSELAALAQQFFGQGLDRMHLPGSWASTPNALEMLAFYAKDMLVAIDDFAPQGCAADVARYHAAADRVFRAAGNQSGRGRLDSNSRLRDPKPPRGLILSTGEDIPRGHSIRARLLILEVSKGEINADALSALQAAARAGEFVRAMGGFLKWMAGNFETVKASFEQRINDLRNQVLRDPAHARTPDIIANLQAAFESYVDFCEDSGSIDAGYRERLAGACWNELRDSAKAQAKHHAAAEPAARFVSLIQACLSSGQAYLAAPDSTPPRQSPEDCGWRNNGSSDWSPRGTCIGWTDRDDIYLEPIAAHQVVQNASRDVGETMPVSEQVLRKRLREKGYLASIDERRETNTVRRKIGGSSKNVLHFLRSTLLPSEDKEDGEVSA